MSYNQLYPNPLTDQLYEPQDPLHDEILQLCRENGIESLAKEIGLIAKNGEIPQLKEYPSIYNNSTFTQNFQSVSPFLPSPTHPMISNIPHMALQSPIQTLTRSTPTLITPTTATTTTQRSTQETSQEPPKKKKRGQAANNNNTTTTTTTTTSTTPTITSTSIQTTIIPTTTTIPSTPTPTTTTIPTPVASGSLVVRQSSSAIAPKDDNDGNKGLRHFSLKVCQKVECKRTTTYNEVADELVAEFANTGTGGTEMTAVEQKNIRRRVYDVLNVLMAMNIIAKDRKEIQWIGLPTNAKLQLEELCTEYNARTERIRKKEESLKELISQRGCYRSLLSRNNLPNLQSVPNSSRIYLPFIVVNTRAQTVINCEVAHDRSKYFFNFSHPFEIHDDSEILRRMGLSEAVNNNNNNTSNNTTTIVIAPIGSNLVGVNTVASTTPST